MDCRVKPGNDIGGDCFAIRPLPAQSGERSSLPTDGYTEILMLASAIISGIGLGSMYGLIALGFHITYVVSNTVNFAQGSAMMLGAVLGYTFGIKLGWPMPLAVARR